MPKQKEVVRLVTPVGRLLYPSIAAPLPADAEYDAGKYVCGLLIPNEVYKEQCKDWGKQILTLAQEVFGAKNIKSLADFRHPIKKGDDTETDYMKGHIFITGKGKYAPSIIDAAKKEMSPDAVANIKGGDYGRLVLTLFTYDTKGNKGVSFGLDVVQYARPGEPLGGGKSKSLELLEELEVEVDSLDDSDLAGADTKVEEFAL